MDALIQTYGYWAVLVGTFLEGETVLILGGFAAHRGYLHLGGVLLAAFVGTLSGDQFFFYLGRRHGRGTLAKYSAWEAKSARVGRLLEKHRVPVILVFRFLYGLRSVTPFAIGLSRIPATQFLLLNALGAAVWASAVGTGGYFFGQGLDLLLADVQRYESAAMAAVAAVGVLVWAGYFVWRRWSLPARTTAEGGDDAGPSPAP